MAYRLVGRRTVAVLDLSLLVWTVAWAAVGLAVAGEVRSLGRVNETLSIGGAAFVDTGRTIASLGVLPLVGDEIGEAGARIEAAGRSALQSARTGRESVDDLTPLLGWSVALVPTAPLVALYGPWRVSRAREVRALRRVLAGGSARHPAFLEFLARRAMENVPVHRLLEVTADPWEDLAAGRHEGLARAELARLGIVDPRAWPPEQEPDGGG